MTKWLKTLFCKHDFEIYKQPVIMRRWEPDWSLGDTAGDFYGVGSYSYYKATEIIKICKKCGYKETDIV